MHSLEQILEWNKQRRVTADGLMNIRMREYLCLAWGWRWLCPTAEPCRGPEDTWSPWASFSGAEQPPGKAARLGILKCVSWGLAVYDLGTGGDGKFCSPAPLGISVAQWEPGRGELQQDIAVGGEGSSYCCPKSSTSYAQPRFHSSIVLWVNVIFFEPPPPPTSTLKVLQIPAISS